MNPLSDTALLGYAASRILSSPPTDKRNFLERFFLELFPHQDPLLGSALFLGACRRRAAARKHAEMPRGEMIPRLAKPKGEMPRGEMTPSVAKPKGEMPTGAMPSSRLLK